MKWKLTDCKSVYSNSGVYTYLYCYVGYSKFRQSHVLLSRECLKLKSLWEQNDTYSIPNLCRGPVASMLRYAWTKLKVSIWDPGIWILAKELKLQLHWFKFIQLYIFFWVIRIHLKNYMVLIDSTLESIENSRSIGLWHLKSLFHFSKSQMLTYRTGYNLYN